MILQKNDFIVSCSALPAEPMHGAEITLKMAQSVILGGANALRVTAADDIKLIKQHLNVPVIGLFKQDFPGTRVRITPNFKHLLEIYNAGADIVAMDATLYPRHNDEKLSDIVKQAQDLNIPIMADIDTYENGLNAHELGFDYISTTLSGYTPETKDRPHEPDFELMTKLVQTIDTPIIAEGRIWTPEQAKQALNTGVHAVVIGSAISRPKLIAQNFATALKND